MTARKATPATDAFCLSASGASIDRPSLTDRMRSHHEAWLEQRRAFARRHGLRLEQLPSMIIPPRCVAAGPLTEQLERDGVLTDLDRLQQFAQLEARSPDNASRVDARLRAPKSKFSTLAIAAALAR